MSNLNLVTKVANILENPNCCKVEGCNNIWKFSKKRGVRYLVKGYCLKHYESFSKHGDALYVEKLKTETAEKHKKCCVEGCENVGNYDPKAKKHYLTKGLCPKHYSRHIRNGSHNIVNRVVGENRDANPLYKTYAKIIQRCYSEKNPAYKNYGGRGILVCKEWQSNLGFSQFLKDMGEKPSKGHSVERRDNDLGYSKDNCYWATRHQQARNRRSNNKFVGVAYDKSKDRWIGSILINGKEFRKYFKTFQAACVYRVFQEIKHFGVPILAS